MITAFASATRAKSVVASRAFFVDKFCYVFRRNMTNVGVAGTDGVDLFLVDVEAEYAVAAPCEL